MKDNPKKVYIDANIFLQFGNSPRSPIFGRLRDLVMGGFIEILTTDLTRREVAKNHAENDFKAISQIVTPKFRKVIKESLYIEFPEFPTDYLMARLLAKYERSTNAMYESLNSRELIIDDVKPSAVFDLYAKSTGIFNSKNKKNQFPDAFILECIKSEASENAPVVIVSNDKDFREPVENEPYIEFCASVHDMTKLLGFEGIQPDVEKFLENNIHNLIDEVESWLSECNLNYDVQESEISNIRVFNLKILEPVSFRDSTVPDGTVLLVGRLQGEAEIAVTHPDWDHTIWIDEYFSYLQPVENISDIIETYFTVEISLIISVNPDGVPKEIEDIRFLFDESKNYFFNSSKDSSIKFS